MIKKYTHSVLCIDLSMFNQNHHLNESLTMTIKAYFITCLLDTKCNKIVILAYTFIISVDKITIQTHYAYFETYSLLQYSHGQFMTQWASKNFLPGFTLKSET